MLRIISFILALSLISIISLSADNRDDAARKDFNIITTKSFEGKSDASILQDGIVMLENGEQKEKAALYFSEIVNRYYSDPKKYKDRGIVAECMRHLANIYMTYDIDYRKAYRYLMSAKQMAEEDGDRYSLAFIDMSLVNLYHMNDTHGQLSGQVKAHVAEGIDNAMASGNDIAITCLLVDIGLFTKDADGWGDYADLVEKIRGYRHKTDTQYTKIYRNILDGFTFLHKGNYANAEKSFLQATDHAYTLRYSERFIFPIDSFLMRVYHESGDTDKEITLAKKIADTSSSSGYKDYEIWMNRYLSDAYKEKGVMDSSDYYHDRVLHLEESLKENNGYESIETLDFLSEIDKINKEVESLSLKHQEERRLRIIIIFTLIIFVLVMAGLLWVHLNLKKSHRILYMKNEEMMRIIEQQKMLKKHTENEEPEATTPSGNPDTTSSSSEEDRDKQEMMRVYAVITDKMDTMAEIFNSAFSLNEMSDILKIPSRVISRSINECHGSNFHQFLNEYRIREATRRMHDPKSANLTIETIAEGVGFKSRTYFTSLFKKITGLTPSEYWKMALKN